VKGKRRRLGGALLALAAAALVWPLGAWAAASGESENTRQAAALIQRMREAPSNYQFVGTALVGWRAGGELRHASVDVHDDAGALEVEAGGSAVFDDGTRAYFHDGSGWTSVLIEPTAKGMPAPDESWDLATRPGRTVAGRHTTLVVAKRADGSVAQRLFVDDDTGLLLARAVLGSDGRVERSVTFQSIEIGAATSVDVPGHAQPQRTEALASVPDGYDAPSSPTRGYELVTRSRLGDGVLFFYSDGLFSASVYEQRGDLNWDALPAGGTTTSVAGNRARAYSRPSGDVLVWENDGLVYTCVSDAPSDMFAKITSGLSGSDRSAPESVVDYVLGPFGWG
jgi:hypothetical protein